MNVCLVSINMNNYYKPETDEVAMHYQHMVSKIRE